MGAGEIGDARAVEPLIAVLQDPDPSIRARVTTSLRQIGDARAVEPLIAALTDENMTVRRGASLALAELGWRPVRDEDKAALKKRQTQLIAQLIIRMTEAYQDAVRNAVAQKRTSLLVIRGESIDLSPEGIDYLLVNLPSAVTDILQKEDTDTIVGVAAMAAALVENPASAGGLTFNPTVTELTSRTLQGELRRRFPGWPG